MAQLSGRVALITGASKGVGRVMSRMFAAEGAAVICAARSRDLVEETTALVKADGGRAIAVVGDAAVEADVLRIVDAGVRAFGKLDTLVNNAGDGGVTKPVQDYTAEDWFYTINSCLTSSYMCTRFAVPQMMKAGGGAIVNISSTAGRRGLAYRIGYCSAKAGQVGMTYGLALELAPHNIRVNAIAPGAVAGDRIDRVIAGQAQVKGVCRGRAGAGRRAVAAQAHVDGRGHRVAGGLSLQRRREEPLRPVHRGDGRRARGLSSTRPCGDPDGLRPSRRTRSRPSRQARRIARPGETGEANSGIF
jgi:NAD(P)-dependent dehydrogenase (short-subunit alcohol dehydrogenase family)